MCGLKGIRHTVECAGPCTRLLYTPDLVNCVNTPRLFLNERPSYATWRRRKFPMHELRINIRQFTGWHSYPTPSDEREKTTILLSKWTADGVERQVSRISTYTADGPRQNYRRPPTQKLQALDREISPKYTINRTQDTHEQQRAIETEQKRVVKSQTGCTISPLLPVAHA